MLRTGGVRLIERSALQSWNLFAYVKLQPKTPKCSHPHGTVCPTHCSEHYTTITGRSCHKYHFCHDKHMFVTTNMCSSQQNTSFVTTKVCLSRKLLLRQNYVCRDKYLSWQQILTKDVFCQDKHVFLSQQNFCQDKIYFCPNKYLLWQKLCQDKNILSQQTSFWYLWQLPPMIYNCTFFNQSAQWNKFPLNIHIGEVGILGLLLLMPLLHHL